MIWFARNSIIKTIIFAECIHKTIFSYLQQQMSCNQYVLDNPYNKINGKSMKVQTGTCITINDFLLNIIETLIYFAE